MCNRTKCILITQSWLRDLNNVQYMFVNMKYVFRARKFAATNVIYFHFSHWCHYRKKREEKPSDIRKWWIIFEPTTAIRQLDRNLYRSQQTNILKIQTEKSNIKNGSSKETTQPDLSILSKTKDWKKKVRFLVFLIHFKYDLITILKAAHQNRFSFFSSPITHYASSMMMMTGWIPYSKFRISGLCVVCQVPNVQCSVFRPS